MMRVTLMVFLACAAAGLGGCAKHADEQQEKATQPPQPAMKAAPATPIAEKKQQLGGSTWNPEWDRMIEGALPADMLSAQAAKAVRSYCPHFAQEPEADKRAFWAYVFQALAGAEAGFNPKADVDHTLAAVAKKDAVSGRSTRQEGLLQLTYEDSKRYGCDFDWEHDKSLPVKDPAKTILQPKNNLLCGVKIMESQIIEQRKPLLVKSSYWSTLRPGTASYRVFSKQMTHVPEACGAGASRKKR